MCAVLLETLDRSDLCSELGVFLDVGDDVVDGVSYVVNVGCGQGDHVDAAVSQQVNVVLADQVVALALYWLRENMRATLTKPFGD